MISQSTPHGHRTILAGVAPALLIVIIVAAYMPAMRGGWVWDDREWVWDNPAVLSPSGLHQIWLEPSSSPQYYPLLFTIFWLQYRLWGLNPAGYHVTNVVLHAMNAILLLTLLRRLAVPGALFAAAIFALHPVQVESVAWVTELKNVLAGFFSLLTLFAWLRFVERRRWQSYVLALLLFTCAMLSKTAASTLPLVMILLAWWKDPTAWRRELPYVAPLLLVALGFGWVTAWREPTDIRRALSFLDRALIAGHALWFYAAKLIWPTHLMAIYPLWSIDAHQRTQYGWLLAAFAVGTALWSLRRRLGVGPLIAVAYFCITLAPTLGFLNFSFMMVSYVADRFQYLPSVGLIALFTAAATVTVKRFGSAGRRVFGAIAALCVLGLGVLTWRQAHMYQDEETFWRANLAINPHAWVAWWGLGDALLQEARYEEAVEQYAVAARLEPTYEGIYHSWGLALEAQGKLEDAAAKYEAVVRLNPRLADPHFRLGDLLFKTGQPNEGIQHLTTAVELNPSEPSLRVILGSMLVTQGRLEEAARQFAEALRLQPDRADAHSGWAVVLVMQGKLDEAVRHYRAALRLAPDDAGTRQGLESALRMQEATQPHSSD